MINEFAPARNRVLFTICLLPLIFLSSAADSGELGKYRPPVEATRLHLNAFKSFYRERSEMAIDKKSLEEMLDEYIEEQAKENIPDPGSYLYLSELDRLPPSFTSVLVERTRDSSCKDFERLMWVVLPSSPYRPRASLILFNYQDGYSFLKPFFVRRLNECIGYKSVIDPKTKTPVNIISWDPERVARKQVKLIMDDMISDKDNRLFESAEILGNTLVVDTRFDEEIFNGAAEVIDREKDLQTVASLVAVLLKMNSREVLNYLNKKMVESGIILEAVVNTQYDKKPDMFDEETIRILSSYAGKVGDEKYEREISRLLSYYAGEKAKNELFLSQLAEQNSDKEYVLQYFTTCNSMVVPSAIDIFKSSDTALKKMMLSTWFKQCSGRGNREAIIFLVDMLKTEQDESMLASAVSALEGIKCSQFPSIAREILLKHDNSSLNNIVLSVLSRYPLEDILPAIEKIKPNQILDAQENLLENISLNERCDMLDKFFELMPKKDDDLFAIKRIQSRCGTYPDEFNMIVNENNVGNKKREKTLYDLLAWLDGNYVPEYRDLMGSNLELFRKSDSYTHFILSGYFRLLEDKSALPFLRKILEYEKGGMYEDRIKWSIYTLGDNDIYKDLFNDGTISSRENRELIQKIIVRTCSRDSLNAAVNVLTKEKPVKSQELLNALIFCKDGRAYDLAMQSVEETEGFQKIMKAETLVLTGDPRAEKVVLELFDNSADTLNRNYMIRGSLAGIGLTEKVKEVLIDVVNDTSESLQNKIDAMEILEEKLRDKNAIRNVREAYKNQLSQILMRKQSGGKEKDAGYNIYLAWMNLEKLYDKNDIQLLEEIYAVEPYPDIDAMIRTFRLAELMPIMKGKKPVQGVTEKLIEEAIHDCNLLESYDMRYSPQNSIIYTRTTIPRLKELLFKELETAVALEPDNPEANSYLARAYSNYKCENKAGESLKYAKKSVALAPEQEHTHISMGDAYLCNKCYEDAMSEYDEAFLLNNESPRAMSRLAVVLTLLGEDGKADEYYSLIMKSGKDEKRMWRQMTAGRIDDIKKERKSTYYFSPKSISPR